MYDPFNTKEVPLTAERLSAHGLDQASFHSFLGQLDLGDKINIGRILSSIEGAFELAKEIPTVENADRTLNSIVAFCSNITESGPPSALSDISLEAINSMLETERRFEAFIQSDEVEVYLHEKMVVDLVSKLKLPINSEGHPFYHCALDSETLQKLYASPQEEWPSIFENATEMVFFEAGPARYVLDRILTRTHRSIDLPLVRLAARRYLCDDIHSLVPVEFFMLYLASTSLVSASPESYVFVPATTTPDVLENFKTLVRDATNDPRAAGLKELYQVACAL